MSFEQELHEDADAQDDFRALRARDEKSTSRIADVSHREGRAHNLSLSPLPSPLLLGAGESASISSGSNPLQSEDNSIIHPHSHSPRRNRLQIRFCLRTLFRSISETYTSAPWRSP